MDSFAKVVILILVLIAVFLVGVLVVDIVLSFNDTTTDVVEILKMERVNGNSDGKYLIFTYKDGMPYEVFENTDNLFRWKFNSSDMYNKIQVGKKYSFVVVGKRIPFLSWYRNIIKVKEIN